MKVLLLPLLLLLFGKPLRAPAETESNRLDRFEFKRLEMAMPFRIVLYAENQEVAEAAAQAAYARIQQLNDIMSDYDPDSELSKLSATSGSGQAVRVSQDLWAVLSRAEALAKRSDGAFDVTVGPYVNLWRRARRQHKLPDPARLAEAGRAVGYQFLKLDPSRQAVELLRPNMKLDLGGIAKGYAIGEAMKTLRAHGIRRALIEGGGDVTVSDPPPGKKGWRFELSSLDVTNAPPPRFLLLKNCAISTSGDLYQRLEIEGKRYSHIVDPHTGIGLTDHSLVNVIATDSTTADSLTKVVSVLGPERGLALVAREGHAVARIMHAPAGKVETITSPGFERYFEQK